MIAAFEATRRPNAMGDALVHARRPARVGRRPTAGSVRPRVPWASARCPSRRGIDSRRCSSSASPTRTRRSARCASSSMTAGWRSGRGTARPSLGWRPSSPTDRPPPTAAPRCSRSCGHPPATPPRRWPASCATSATTGDRSSAIALLELIGRLEIAIGILAEERRALMLRFGGGPAAGRRPGRDARDRRRWATSRRRSRPIRRGCPRSC